jgi:hypothetical protein
VKKILKFRKEPPSTNFLSPGWLHHLHPTSDGCDYKTSVYKVEKYNKLNLQRYKKERKCLMKFLLLDILKMQFFFLGLHFTLKKRRPILNRFHDCGGQPLLAPQN